jgi:hypothetical protein
MRRDAWYLVHADAPAAPFAIESHLREFIVDMKLSENKPHFQLRVDE